MLSAHANCHFLLPVHTVINYRILKRGLHFPYRHETFHCDLRHPLRFLAAALEIYRRIEDNARETTTTSLRFSCRKHRRCHLSTAAVERGAALRCRPSSCILYLSFYLVYGLREYFLFYTQRKKRLRCMTRHGARLGQGDRPNCWFYGTAATVLYCPAFCARLPASVAGMG